MEATVTAMPPARHNPAEYGEMLLEIMTLVSRKYPDLTAVQMKIVLMLYAKVSAPSPYHLGRLAQDLSMKMDSLKADLQILQSWALVQICNETFSVHRTEVGIGLLRGLMQIAANKMK